MHPRPVHSSTLLYTELIYLSDLLEYFRVSVGAPRDTQMQEMDHA